MTEDIAAVIETELVQLSWQLTEPRERECLRCYLLRMLAEFGCDCTHRWTLTWRRQCAPQAAQLIGRLRQLGGACDCEVILNVFPDYLPVDGPLPCAGQPRAGSAMPCDARTLRRTA
jgi:hypothetical protein